MTTVNERLAILEDKVAEAHRIIEKFSAKPPSRFFAQVIASSREDLAEAKREIGALEQLLAQQARRRTENIEGPKRAAAGAERLRELIIERKGPTRLRVWSKKGVGTRLYFPGDAGYLVFGWDGGVSSMDRGRQTLAWSALYQSWRKAVRDAIDAYRVELDDQLAGDVEEHWKGRGNQEDQFDGWAIRIATSEDPRGGSHGEGPWVAEHEGTFVHRFQSPSSAWRFVRETKHEGGIQPWKKGRGNLPRRTPLDPVLVEASCFEVQKAQGVRLLDVFLLGPGTMVAAAVADELPGPARAALMGYGLLTVRYNARNYTATRRANRKRRKAR